MDGWIVTETSVPGFQPTLRNIPKVRRPQLHRDGSSKPRTAYTVVIWLTWARLYF